MQLVGYNSTSPCLEQMKDEDSQLRYVIRDVYLPVGSFSFVFFWSQCYHLKIFVRRYGVPFVTIWCPGGYASLGAQLVCTLVPDRFRTFG